MSTIAEVLDQITDKGIVLSIENDTVCCPDCTKVYVFASVETFLKFAETIGGLNCCLHTTSSVETNLKLVEAVGGTLEVPTCPQNYNSCIDSLFEDLTPEEIDRILDKGIVEYGSISGDSQVCRIHDFINLSYNNQIGAVPSTKGEILDRLLDKGIVIACSETEIIIASVETYLKWADAVGLSVVVALPSVDEVIEETLFNTTTTTTTLI